MPKMRDDVVGVFTVTDVVLAIVITEITHVIGHFVDGRKWNQMVAAIERADDHRTNGYFLDCAEQAADFHDIVTVHYVFKMYENPRADIRSESFRVGKKCVSTCRSWCWTFL